MQRYEIAGLKVDMAVSGRTQKQAAAYAAACQGDADLTITCDPDQVLLRNPRLQSPDVAQYLATGADFAWGLLDFGGFQLHASAVVLDGRAYLFSAPSGTGKSTHTEKWVRLFGASYLNDDKPAVRCLADTWMAYGTPWSGKHDLSDPRGAPIGGIAFLRRGEHTHIQRLSPAQALPHLMRQTVYRLTKKKMEQLLPLMDSLLRQVPVWMLVCRNDDDAARIAAAAMTERL